MFIYECVYLIVLEWGAKDSRIGYSKLEDYLPTFNVHWQSMDTLTLPIWVAPTIVYSRGSMQIHFIGLHYRFLVFQMLWYHFLWENVDDVSTFYHYALGSKRCPYLYLNDAPNDGDGIYMIMVTCKMSSIIYTMPTDLSI